MIDIEKLEIIDRCVRSLTKKVTPKTIADYIESTADAIKIFMDNVEFLQDRLSSAESDAKHWKTIGNNALEAQRLLESQNDQLRAQVEAAKGKILEDTKNADAPTDSGIAEFDKLCGKYNLGEIDLTSLCSNLWNSAIAANNADVQIPKKLESDLDNKYYDDCYINGFNACVDEVFRINSLPPINQTNPWRDAILTTFQSIDVEFKDDPDIDVQDLLNYWYNEGAANKINVPEDKVLIDESLIRFFKGEHYLYHNYSKIWFGAKDVKPYWWRQLLPSLPPLKDESL